MDKPATQITVTRALGRDVGYREVRLWLDEQPFATLRYKESVTQELAPGPHTLRAHNTMVGKTLTFEVAEGEHVRFTTSNRGGCGSSLIYLFGAGPIYLSLQQEHEQPAE